MTQPIVPSVEHVDRRALEAVQGWLRGYHPQMTQDLQAYVETETPSTDKESLKRGVRWIDSYLLRSLGAPDEVTTVDGGRRGDVRIAEYRTPASQTVMVLCHYDTVWDLGALARWPFSIAGDIMRGPGVFDMKAGFIQAVWALRALRAVGVSRPSVRFVLNGDEELGSEASREVIEDQARHVDAVLVMEPGVSGALKTSRKGVGIFDIALHGVEAHAGLDPENGASAVDELARVILHLRSEQNPDAGTTINFGTIDGGTRSNVIPGRAHATMDVRVSTQPEAERIDKAVAAVKPVDDRVRLEITGGWNRPVMERTPQVGALFEAARELGSWLWLDVEETSAGGGSDANFLVGGGLPLLDGLGGVGAGAHSRDEHVRLTPTWEQVPLTAALLALYGTEPKDR